MKSTNLATMIGDGAYRPTQLQGQYAQTEIPAEIIAAAQAVSNWFKVNGHERWELCDIQSRNTSTFALLTTVEHNKWSVCFNTRISKWTVQEQNQVCGNIGEDADLFTAIAKAIVQHDKDTRRICKACDCPIDELGCGCNPRDA